MFWLALLTRDTGVPASRRLQIKDEVVALDLDFAVSYRLFLLRNEENKATARQIAYEVSKIFGGGQDEYEENEDDPFADANTVIW